MTLRMKWSECMDGRVSPWTDVLKKLQRCSLDPLCRVQSFQSNIMTAEEKKTPFSLLPPKSAPKC